MTKPTVDFSKQRVLVVENHGLMRRLLHEMLRGFGVQEIREAKSVPPAIDFIYREDFDAVILDFFLGDLDGADFARAVRHDPKCRNREVPILLITAMPDHHKVVKGLEAGIDGMLAKPIAPRDLYMRLQAMMTLPREFVVGDGYAGPGRRQKILAALRPSHRQAPRPEVRSGRGANGLDESLFA